MNRTKVMVSRERQKVMQKAVRWPCGVFGRGVFTALPHDAMLAQYMLTLSVCLSHAGIVPKVQNAKN